MKKFLLGIIGGVSLGMLFAPEKGKILRKKLSESDNKMKDFGKEMISAGKNASQEVQDFLEKKEVQDFLDTKKANISDLLQSGKELSLKGKKELTDIASKVTRNIKSKTENFEKDELIDGIKKFFSPKKEEKDAPSKNQNHSE